MMYDISCSKRECYARSNTHKKTPTVMENLQFAFFICSIYKIDKKNSNFFLCSRDIFRWILFSFNRFSVIASGKQVIEL